MAIVLAIPAGVRSAQRRNLWDDRVLSVVSLFGLSFPNFALGPVLILFFAVKLGWLPVSGSGTFAHLVLPAITMGGALAAILTRMVRTSMLEELGQDYIRTARAKGLSERTVAYRHALRNAMIPIITVLGLQFGALLAGAIVTETIFSWPGIGRLTIQAIGNRDYYLVQGCILAIGLTYVAVNFLTDSAVFGGESEDKAVTEQFETALRSLRFFSVTFAIRGFLRSDASMNFHRHQLATDH